MAESFSDLFDQQFPQIDAIAWERFFAGNKRNVLLDPKTLKPKFGRSEAEVLAILIRCHKWARELDCEFVMTPAEKTFWNRSFLIRQ